MSVSYADDFRPNEMIIECARPGGQEFMAYRGTEFESIEAGSDLLENCLEDAKELEVGVDRSGWSRALGSEEELVAVNAASHAIEVRPGETSDTYICDYSTVLSNGEGELTYTFRPGKVSAIHGGRKRNISLQCEVGPTVLF